MLEINCDLTLIKILEEQNCKHEIIKKKKKYPLDAQLKLDRTDEKKIK